MQKIAFCLVLMMSASVGVNAQNAVSSSTGVFTDEQARRGAAAYNANCATCHGTDLHSTDKEVPNLTEQEFKYGWVGKTIGERFEVARDTMPPRDEHSLDDQVYLDIVTYILKFNKVPSGKTELKPDIEILKRIVIANPG